jgi:hypothetical protein
LENSGASFTSWKCNGNRGYTGESAVVKSEKSHLRSRQKVRTALKEFLAAADKTLCKTDGEVRKTIHSDNGYRMIGGREAAKLEITAENSPEWMMISWLFSSI